MDGRRQSWQTANFGDMAELVRDSVSPNGMGNTPYIGLEHIEQGQLSLLGVGSARDVTSTKLRFKRGDILFGKLRPYFRKVVRARIDGICSTDIWVVRPSPGVDSGYLFYVMASQEFVDDAARGSEGTRMPRAKWNFVSLQEHRIPKISEQRAIAHILGTLDDKIELHRRMNETLEAIMRALFESWFVDFDPVRAKMEGRSTCLPQDIAELFPDRMVDSETGEIPESWVRKSIYRFADVVYGAPFASKQFNAENEGIPLIRIRDLATHNPSVSTLQVHRTGHLIDPGDILVGMDGAFRLEVWKGPAAWLNQRVCHFEPRSGIPTSFLVGALQEPLALFERGKVGTTVIHLGKKDLDTIRILHPGEEILGKFAKSAEPLLEKVVANSREVRILAALRDALLPKLISGQIRVPDAGSILESAA